MAERSVNRYKHESNILTCNKEPNYNEIRANSEQYERGKEYCSICTECISTVKLEVSPENHCHYSSISLRTTAPLDPLGQFLGTTCNSTVHPVKSSHRMLLVITSSTMHNWQGKRYMNNFKGDPVHLKLHQHSWCNHRRPTPCN